MMPFGEDPAAPRSPVVRPVKKLDRTDFSGLARQIAQEEGVDPDLFERLVSHESGWDPQAFSARGAMGLAQLRPDTALELGVDPSDPIQNLQGGARYLAQQLVKFGGDRRLALAAYNAGPGAVERHGGIPPFPETQAYVQRILGPAGPPSRAQGVVAPVRKVTLPGKAPLPTPPPITPGPIPPPSDVRPELTGLPTATGYTSQAPPTLTGITGFALPAGGSIAGAAAGGRLGAAFGPLGAAVGTVAGGALGSMAGETAQTGVEALAGTPPSRESVAERATGAGLTSAAVDLAARGVGRVPGLSRIANRLLAPMAESQTAQGKQAVATLTRVQEKPPLRKALSAVTGRPTTEAVPLGLPGQFSPSKGLTTLQNFAEGGSFGGGMEAVRAQQTEAIGELAAGLRNQFGPAVQGGEEAVGQTVQANLAARYLKAKAPAVAHLEQAREGFAGVQAKLSPDLEDFLTRDPDARRAFRTALMDMSVKAPEQLGAEWAGLGAGAGVQEALAAAGFAVGAPGSREVALNDLVKLRTHLLEASRQIARRSTTPGTTAGAVKKLTGLLTQNIEEAGAAAPEALAAWQAGSKAYQQVQQRYQTEYLRKLGKANPSVLTDTVYKPGGQGAPLEQIRALRQAVDPGTFKVVQRQTLGRVLDHKGRLATGAEIRARLAQIGPARLRELYGDAAPEIVKFSRLLEQVQQKATTRGHSTGAFIQSAGVIGFGSTFLQSLISGTAVRVGSLAMALTPSAIGHALASPLGRIWLTRGLQAKTTEEGTAALGKLAAFLAREGFGEDTTPPEEY